MPWEYNETRDKLVYRPIPFTLGEKEGARCPYRNPECPKCYPEIQRAEVNRAALIRAAVVNAALEQFPQSVKAMGLGRALDWHGKHTFRSGITRTFRHAIRRHFFALLEATNG